MRIWTIRNWTVRAIALIGVVAVSGLIATAGTAVAAGEKSTQTEAIWKSLDKENQTITVKVKKPGRGKNAKRLKRGKNPQFLQLLPENADYEPIDVDLQVQDFAIEGVSVGVLRRG